ncbi:MAG: ADP-ribosylglycohydrolase family protein, partial [Trueperaceae bacterium]|nr:ADP-ribosylglycohydrolase family protein [Trueperaceae bacterium]
MVRITWLKPEERIEHEFRQLREEGADPGELEAQWHACRGEDLDRRRARALELLDAAVPLRRNDDDVDVLALLRGVAAPASPALDRDELARRLEAGWIGRAAGCLLGKPVEKTPREGIREILQSIGEWPLRRYFTAQGVPDEVLERYPWNRASRPTSMRENIECMPEDDDLNYSMLNLHVLETYGPDFTTDDVATVWLQMMPVLTVFTAERVTYENLLRYLLPPLTALHRNPYREWIGAQIRADVWGWVSPGDPARAAELAWRDARLSHSANGIYGEMLTAAMVAKAFATDDVLAVIEAGLQTIPEDSRLAEAVRFARDLPDRTSDWDEALDLLHARYGHYHWVHTINNAALVTAALRFGQGDFERTICNAVMGGWDTDCNGATVGSIIGVMHGPDAIPEAWSGPLRNRVRTSLKGFDDSRLDELARRTL